MSTPIFLTIFFSLCTAFLYGLAPVLFRKAYERFSVYSVYVIDGFVGGTLVFLPFIATGQLDLKSLPNALLATSLYSLSYLVYLGVLNIGKFSIVNTIVQTYPIFTVIMAIAVGHERLPIELILILVFMVTMSALLANGEKTVDDRGNGSQRDMFLKSIAIAFFTSVLIGISDFYLNLSIDTYNIYNTTLAIYLTQIFFSLIILISSRRIRKDIRLNIKHKRDLLNVIMGSFAITFGAVFFYLAFKYGLASIVSPLSALSPLIAVIFSGIVLKEKLSRKQWWILVSIVLALILFSTLIEG